MNEIAYTILWARICESPISFFFAVCCPLMFIGWYMSDDPPCLCPEKDCPLHPKSKTP